MILKHADPKTDLEDLRSLLSQPDIRPDQTALIEQEIRFIQAGQRGEQETAHELNVHYGATRNWAVLHDLRLEVGGVVAQIDHLLVNRWLDMWVCESKHFSEGIAINEYGEFSAFYQGQERGIASPIEQNHKHIRVLQRLFDSPDFSLPKRLGITLKPTFFNAVLISQRAQIHRPPTSLDTLGVDLSTLVKNDQFFTRIQHREQELGLLSAVRIVSVDTLKALTQQIVSHHRPKTFDWAAKFGLTTATSSPSTTKGVLNSDATSATHCQECRVPISSGVADYCKANPTRFRFKVLCMRCQRKLNSVL